MERGQNDHIGPSSGLIEGLKAGGTGQTEAPVVRTLTLEGIARACYAVNAVFCRIIGDTPRDWDECKASVIAGVQKALDGATEEQLHDAWCEFQKANGWVYGELKDATAKTHPCLVPYDQLPAAQRQKDQFFRATVGALGSYLP